MTNNTKFDRDLRRGDVFASGIGHTLARHHTGSYQSYPYITGVGQPSGDGGLTIGGTTYHCEFKAEVNQYANLFLETHGAGGRDSGLTQAAQSGFLWGHYNGRTDVLVVARASRLLPFVEEHRGQSGIRFIPHAGDGGHAAGFVVPVKLLTGQPWVKSYTNFSGTFLTGEHTLHFG